MEIYLREGFSEGWGVSLIALDSLAPLGEMTESCGDAASAVLQRKRRAGTLGGGPRDAHRPVEPCVLRVSARIHRPPRRGAGLGCSLQQLRRSEAARREFLPWGSAKYEFKRMVPITGCRHTARVCEDGEGEYWKLPMSHVFNPCQRVPVVEKGAASSLKSQSG